ncbi:MAG TPA: hypothetical protein ENH40_06685 [Nitrospirae bacterium]|nr:hypothetical protein [Nitrospirota bacterium]
MQAERGRLLPIAIEKFSRKGHEFSPEECVVIGDTPRDVRCAKIHGAHCIAVATGPYSRDDLLDTDADIVLDSPSKDISCNVITHLDSFFEDGSRVIFLK